MKTRLLSVFVVLASCILSIYAEDDASTSSFRGESSEESDAGNTGEYRDTIADSARDHVVSSLISAPGEPTSGDSMDKSLDMRPSEIEPTATPEQAEARFDFFRTQPTFQVPKITVEYMIDDSAALAPGYYFNAPYSCGAMGPHIFDQNGELVYWGVDQISGRVKNFSPCNGPSGEEDHLCWSEAFYDEWHHEYVRNRVFDGGYNQVGRDWGAEGGSVYPNSHEFNMLRTGNHFLQIVYEFKIVNLTEYRGLEEGWVYDGCFQEVDTDTSVVTFSWCAADHFSLDQTYMYLNTPGQENFTEGIAGIGTFNRPWDFIHLNSVDKTPDGDYIVSSRHFNAIFKVAGRESDYPGEVLWQLGGKENNFIFEDDFTFSRQHHARYLGKIDDYEILSLFNNGFNIRNAEALEGLSSSGQIVKVDTSTYKVTLLRDFRHPHHADGWRESITLAEGSMDYIHGTGGAVIGWGSLPDISEFGADGTLLFHVNIANHTGRSYRAWKKPWIGKPHWPPALVAYSQTCGSDATKQGSAPLVAHVSWNGATEVVSWRFSVSTASRHGPWLRAGVFAKQGFETEVDLSGSLALRTFGFAPYVKVEALDAQGNVLGNTTAATFVPSPELNCSADGCPGMNFQYTSTLNVADRCPFRPARWAPAGLVILFLLLCVSGILFGMTLLARRCWRPSRSEVQFKWLEKGFDRLQPVTQKFSGTGATKAHYERLRNSREGLMDVEEGAHGRQFQYGTKSEV